MSSNCLFLDTSALLSRYLPDSRRAFVGATLAEHRPVETPRSPTAATGNLVVSALARSELLLALHQVASGPSAQRELWRTVRQDWDHFWEVPIDGRSLSRATEIGAHYGLSLVDALHLAAADRLPSPVTFLTLDRRQIPAAADLGFAVASPEA